MNARLEPGDKAPDFSLTDDTGAQVSLGDFAGRKVILYFYPAASTPGCTTQACDFRDNIASLRLHERLGFERVAHFREVGWKFGRWLDLVFMQRPL